MVQRLIHRPIGLPELLLPRPADQATLGLPGRVTLITSATGYGKSTLLAAWARQQEHPIAWFSPITAMQPEEVRPVLEAALLDAIGRSDISLSEPGPIDSIAWASEFRAIVEEFGKPLTLVLDGPEQLYGDVGPLQRALRIMVEHQPANLAVIIVSRNFPYGAAEAARLLGTLDIVDERQLRIPDAVVADLLLERGVSKTHVGELVEFLDGWPAAIRIALAVITADTSVDQLRQQVNELGSARFFANALIDRVPEELRHALISTSILKIVTPDLGQVLGLSQVEGTALLGAYEAGIPMTRRSEANGRAFNVHTIFRDELLERLRRQSAASERELRLKAAEHFVATREYGSAIEQFLGAGEGSRALAVLKSHYTELLEAGYGVRMRTWFDRAGEKDSPRVDRLRQQIYGALIDGQLALTESLLASYEAEISERELPMGYQVFLYLNRAWVAQARGDVDGSIAFARAALTALEEREDEDPRRGEYLNAAHDYIAQAAVVTDQPSENDPRFAAVITAAGADPRPSLWQDVGHPGLMAHLAIYRGEYHRALAFGERAMAATPSDLEHSVLFPWHALVAVAGAHREMGRPQSAVDLIGPRLETIQRIPMLVYAVDLLAIHAHALADLGRTAEGTESFKIARTLVETFGRGWWASDRLDVHEARFLLRHGDTARAAQIAERVFDSGHAKELRLRIEAVRAPRRAQRILASLSRHTPSQELMFRLFSALIQSAQSAARTEHLTFALQIAQEHGTFRHLIDAGEPVVEMLTAHSLSHPTRYLEGLLAKHNEAKNALARAAGTVSLSTREHQILGLLASDMTLPMLARTLFVSQNTLKTHLRNLYRKMQVSDRQAAVEKGRQLLLIS
jgi:LuxR family maltose regulon positive regulatory protein